MLLRMLLGSCSVFDTLVFLLGSCCFFDTCDVLHTSRSVHVCCRLRGREGGRKRGREGGCSVLRTYPCIFSRPIHHKMYKFLPRRRCLGERVDEARFIFQDFACEFSAGLVEESVARFIFQDFCLPRPT